jgi:hypothetical protein
MQMRIQQQRLTYSQHHAEQRRCSKHALAAAAHTHRSRLMGPPVVSTILDGPRNTQSTSSPLRCSCSSSWLLGRMLVDQLWHTVVVKSPKSSLIHTS